MNKIIKDGKRPQNTLWVCRSNVTDIFYNFAVEDWLFKRKCGGTALFLWVNDKVVVIGRNQRAKNECDLAAMREKGVMLARRRTGGGAVYHDKNNLCFSFISDNASFSKEKNFQAVTLALKTAFGLCAEVSGRNDMTLDGKKFSGSAYYIGRTKTLHHGTLLISTDTQVLAGCLTPSEGKLARHGVRSVVSRIMNLKEAAPDITKDALCDALIKSSQKVFCGDNGRVRLIDLDKLPQKTREKLAKTAEKLRSADAVKDNLPPEKDFVRRLARGVFCVGAVFSGDKIKFADISFEGLNLYSAEQFQSYIKGKTEAELEAFLDNLAAQNPRSADELTAILARL